MAEKRRRYGDGTVIKNDSGTVTIRKRYTINGKTTMKRFTGKNLSEAKKIKQAFEDKMRLSPYQPDNKNILLDYMKEWAELYKSKSVKATTYDSLEYTIARIEKYDIALYQMNQLDTDLFQTFFNQLTEDGYALETIKKTYNQINNCLKKAVSKKDIANNPLIDVELPSPDEVLKEAKEIQIFDDEDVEKIYNEAYSKFSTGKYKYRHGYVIVFMLNTGLRIGECLGLDIDNVDLQDKKIEVDKTVSLVKNRDGKSQNKFKQNISSPKTKKSKRTVPLSKKAVEALEMAISLRSNLKNQAVFQSENGTRLNARNVTRCFDSILKNSKTKVEQAGLHSLRHTFASKLIRKKVDIKIVSELLGHSKVSTTYNIYAHLIEGEKESAISVLDD